MQIRIKRWIQKFLLTYFDIVDLFGCFIYFSCGNEIRYIFVTEYKLMRIQIKIWM